jgi:SAM-dependent methyltransferase
VADPGRVFAEVSRVLRPGGFFIFLTPNARAVVTLINRTLRPMQHTLVRRLYGRAESDTFPVLYRANGHARLDRLAAQNGLAAVQFYEIPDPTYLAFNSALFGLSRVISRVTPPVHLVGIYRRASG